MDNIISKHERIALQFSGGKDSLAMLYLMREYWDRLTVYWVNSGDAFPETIALVESVRQLVLHSVEIAGNQPQVIAQFGIPTDLLPASATPIGLAGSGRTGALMQDRYSCCYRTIMYPLAQRMIDDGITLVVRGQKNADALKSPLRSGAVENGIEYLFPLEDWTDADVYAFLSKEGATRLPFYDSMSTTPDCMTCSAWWSDGRAAYLRERHPIQYDVYQERLDAIGDAAAEFIVAYNAEVSGRAK